MSKLIPRSELKGTIDHPGSATVLGTDDSGKVLLINTQRRPSPLPQFEIPGGVSEPNETPEQTARRELEEETGYSFELSRHFHTVSPSVGYSNEWIAVFEAQVHKKHEQSEYEAQFFSKAEVKALIQTGQVIDAHTLATLWRWIQEEEQPIIKPEVLFICTGNYYRSRFCELYFNHLIADNKVLADSRGLWAHRKINEGFISPHTVEYMNGLGIPLGPLRFPEQQETRHFQQSPLVIALDESEHRPMMDDMFPEWAGKIEYWQVHDIDFTEPTIALNALKKQVEALVSTFR